VGAGFVAGIEGCVSRCEVEPGVEPEAGEELEVGTNWKLLGFLNSKMDLRLEAEEREERPGTLGFVNSKMAGSQDWLEAEAGEEKPGL
jgi:hypothetical protein